MSTKKEKGLEAVPVAVRKEPKPEKLEAWGPAAMFDELRNELEEFWMRPWRGLRLQRFAHMEKEGWLPSTDVLREHGTLVVKADLPGMTKEDVKVSLDNGDLLLQGERRHEEKVEEKDFIRSERSYGSFYRRLPLPEGVDPSKISAKVADGVLEVRVPLPETATKKPQRIAVR